MVLKKIGQHIIYAALIGLCTMLTFTFAIVGIYSMSGNRKMILSVDKDYVLLNCLKEKNLPYKISGSNFITKVRYVDSMERICYD